MNRKVVNMGVLKKGWILVNVSLNLFFSLLSYAQPAYNACNSALDLCPGIPVSINNLNANKTFCTGCEDDFTLCFSANNTIWLTFRSNETGGFSQIDFSNPVFEPGKGTQIQASIIQAGAPCDASTYTAIGGCVFNETANFILSANLAPDTDYYIVLNGNINGAGVTEAAEFTLDALLSGPGVDRPTPLITVEQDKGFYCRDEVVTLTAHLSNCPDSSLYQWFVNGVLIAQTVDSIFQTTALISDDVVTVSNSCYTQCTVFPSANTPIMTIITFDVDAGQDIILGNSPSVALNGSTTAPDYFWSPKLHISDTGVLNPTVGPTETTTYFLTGVLFGCQYTDAVTVFVDNGLIIPSAFTPNGDGANDFWVIEGIEAYPNCLVQIFDRWGQGVFSTSGYSEKKAWDGKKNGRLLNESTYFYVIELRNGTDEVLKGPVSIIK